MAKIQFPITIALAHDEVTNNLTDLALSKLGLPSGTANASVFIELDSTDDTVRVEVTIKEA